MKKKLVGAVLAASIIGSGCSVSVSSKPVPNSKPSVSCSEDQACWNWRTMGNRTRGIVLPDGRPGLQFAGNRDIPDSWPCDRSGKFAENGEDTCVAR